MTVEELISILEEYNPNATVLMYTGDVNQEEIEDVLQSTDERYVVIG